MESVELSRLLLVGLEFELVFSVAESSDELADSASKVDHDLPLVLSASFVSELNSFDSILNTHGIELVLEVGMLDQKLTDLVAKVVDDVVFILLPDLVKELIIQHREHLKLVCCFLYYLVNALGLHINRFTHLLN